MAFSGKGRKVDWVKLAEELGLHVPPDAKVAEIKTQICKDPDFEEEFVLNLFNAIVEARLEEETHRRKLEESQEAHRRKLEEAEFQAQEAHKRKLEETRIQAEIEAQKQREQHEFELEKLRLSNVPEVDVASELSRNGGLRPSRELQKIMQRYNPEVSDISLYLVMFERQARKANVEEKDWVSHLMALLPLDIVQIILREPEDKSEDYEYVKQTLLQRFKLSPEAFRAKFAQHQRRVGSLWKDFAFELRNYLEEWLKGVKVQDFEALKDLMLTDQIKRRVGPEIRDHFIDEWGKLVSSSELVNKVDEYESVRKNVRKAPSFVKYQDKRPGENQKTFSSKKVENAGNSAERFKPGNSRDRHSNREEKWRDNNFEKRRTPECFSCGSKNHLRPQCPKLAKKEPPEVINNLRTLGLPEELIAPHMSTARINGQEMSVLRDTGATIDLVSFNHITPQMLLGEKVWVKQPLDLHPIGLPLARIEIEGEGFGNVITRAAVVSSQLGLDYYLLGNRTAQLMKKQGHRPQLITSILSQSREKEKPEPPVLEAREEVPGTLSPPEDYAAEATADLEGDVYVRPPGFEEFSLVRVNKKEMVIAQNSCTRLAGIRDRGGKQVSRDRKMYRKGDLSFRQSDGPEKTGLKKNSNLKPSRLMKVPWAQQPYGYKTVRHKCRPPESNRGRMTC